ncbi:hypothetical protein HHI36_017296 [Cryptolaemus montrouzieri]|uniref:Uncharacterized protein n=1 Tax=Cryptolaemus montrouzieri TaxID=559131 RepID=A0ABD2NMG6_9CUCU
MEENGVCNNIVEDNEQGLLCDEFMIWKHHTCISMSYKTYLKISKSQQPSHYGPSKSNTSVPLHTPTKAYTIADVMEKLNDMERKYNILFERYNNQLEINEELKEETINTKNQLNKTEQNELNGNIILYGNPYEVNETVKDKLNMARRLTNTEISQILVEDSNEIEDDMVFDESGVESDHVNVQHDADDIEGEVQVHNEPNSDSDDEMSQS